MQEKVLLKKVKMLFRKMFISIASHKLERWILAPKFIGIDIYKYLCGVERAELHFTIVQCSTYGSVTPGAAPNFAVRSDGREQIIFIAYKQSSDSAIGRSGANYF